MRHQRGCRKSTTGRDQCGKKSERGEKDATHRRASSVIHPTTSTPPAEPRWNFSRRRCTMLAPNSPLGSGRDTPCPRCLACLRRCSRRPGGGRRRRRAATGREVRAGGRAEGARAVREHGRAVPAGAGRDGARPVRRRAARAGRSGREEAPTAADLYRKPGRLLARLPGRARSTPAAPTSSGSTGSPRASRPPRTRTSSGAGQARPAVLVLLPLQRLEQQARERLGDDPARLRRRDGGGGARSDAGARRLLAARGSRERDLGRREAREAGRAPGRLPGRRLPRQPVRPVALSRARRADRIRLRRHARARRGYEQTQVVLLPSEPAGRRRPVRLARLPRAMGPGGVRARTAARPARRSRASGRSRSPGSTRNGGPTTSRSRPRARVAPTATGFFCTAVAKGSEIYLRFLRNPFFVLGVLAAIVLFAVWLSRRTNWSPAPPDPIRQRRDGRRDLPRRRSASTAAGGRSSSGSG